VPLGSKNGTDRVQIELLAEKTAVSPGDRVTIALKQTIKPGWHTYWTNPGDSGEPTHIGWDLPVGASAGPIQWPLPDAIEVGPLMNYGYSDEVVLLSDLTVPETVTGPSFDISADVRWLVCEEICVPESAPVKLSLPIVDKTVSTPSSPGAGLIANARSQVPQPTPWPAEYDVAEDADGALTIRVAAGENHVPPQAEAYFFPLQWGELAHAAPQNVAFRDGDLYLRTKRGDAFGEKPPASIEGVLAVTGENGERRGYKISAAYSGVALSAPDFPLPQTADASGGLSIWLALVFAFLGGLILNLMPCVFPVLSLKALSLASNADDAPQRRLKGVTYFAGVLASFAFLAAALLALRAGGGAIGWGMQFQSPAFVLVMMALFLGLALNLSGVFCFGASACNMGDSLTRKSGLGGYFFTGVLATVVATPCTAPFMGAAMGYALTQSAASALAVFLALGVGFALPFMLLGLFPHLLRVLPRPGHWMISLRQFLAFPMYGAAIWLVWVLSLQAGPDGLLVAMVSALALAFGLWSLGRAQRAEGFGRKAGLATAAVAIVSAAALTAYAGVSTPPAAQAQTSVATSTIAYEPYTAARLEALRAEGRPVFVNATAAWCITCLVNDRVALSGEALKTEFDARKVASLKADWTNGNPEITALLAAQQRSGVPLYLYYAPGAQAPVVLPQLLTESIVLAALKS
jgi:thiol:disulfide interchange protein DsbD